MKLMKWNAFSDCHHLYILLYLDRFGPKLGQETTNFQTLIVSASSDEFDGSEKKEKGDKIKKIT